jgi:hypothetical protein
MAKNWAVGVAVLGSVLDLFILTYCFFHKSRKSYEGVGEGAPKVMSNGEDTCEDDVDSA